MIRKGRIIAPRALGLFGTPAGLPRAIGPADPAVVSPRSVSPLLNVYDPPVQPARLAPAALPASGVGDDVEVRTIDMPWPSSNGILTVAEVSVYATTGQWKAIDVYIEDLDDIEADQVLTIRVYAVSAAGPATIVASGRFTQGGDAFPSAAVGGPQWVCAARAQAERFLVTFQVGVAGNPPLVATPTQTAKITVVASNRSDSPPPNLGAIPISPVIHNSAAAALETFSGFNAELLMVQGVADPAAAAPRFLHVHNRASAAAVVGAAPLFSFPLGLGASSPLQCTEWFPGGLRSYGTRGWQLAVSSTQLTTTLAAGVVNGLFR